MLPIPVILGSYRVPKLNEFLTVGQAAQYLGVSKDTLRRWDKSGKLAARRHPVTGYRLYLKRDLDPILHGVSEEGRPQPGTRRSRAKSKPTEQ